MSNSIRFYRRRCSYTRQLAKGVAGKAVELENGENEPRRNIEPRNGPEPETVALPDALPIALVDESLPVGTNKLYDVMLGTDSEFVNKFFQARKCFDIHMGQWTVAGGKTKRQVRYTTPLKKNALGPSEAACIEEYTVISKEEGSWVVTLYVTTPKVPFGDAFHQNLQWACQPEGQSRCRLRVTGEVQFTKGCFVKGIIQKASKEGMKEAYQLYMDILRADLGIGSGVTPKL